MGLRAVLCAVYFVTRPIYGFYEPCTPDVGCKWNVRNALPLSCCGGGPYLPTDPPCLPPLLNAPVNCQTGASVNPIYQQQQNPNSFFNIPPLYPGVPKVVCWTLCPNSQVINPQSPLLQFPSSFVNNAQQYTSHPPPVNYLQPLPSPPFSYHTGSRSLSTNNQYESQQNPMINYPQKHQSPPITGPEAVRLVTLAPPEPRRPLFAFGLLGLTGNPKPNNTLQGIVKKSDNKRLEPLLNAPREAVSSTAKTMQPEEHRALPINYKLSIDQIPSSQINYPQQHPAPLSQAYPRQYPSAPQQFPYPPPIINYPGSQISYPQPYPKTIPDFMLKYFQKDPTLNQPPYPLNYYSQQYPTARLEPVQPAVGLPFPPEPVWKSLFNLMPPAKTQSPPFNNMLPKLDQNNRFNFLPPNEQYRGPQINYPQQYPDIQLPVNFQRNLSPPSNQYPLFRLLPSQTVGQPTAIRNSINSLPPVNQYQSPYIFPQQYPNLQLPVNYYPQSYPTSLSNYPQIYPSHPMNYHQTLLNTPPINYPTASRDLSPNSYIEEFPAAKPGMYSPVNSGPLNSYLLPYQNPNIPPRSVWNPIPPYPTYSPIEGVKNSLINNMPLTNPQNSEYNYIPLDEPYWRVPVNHSQWLPNVSPIQQQPKIPFFNSYFEQNPYPMMKFPQIYPSSAMNYPEQYPRLLTNDIVPQEPNLMVTGPPPPALSYTTQQYPSLQLPVNYHPQSYPTSLSNYPQIYPSHPMNYYPTLLNTPPINYPTASRDLSPNSYIEEFPAAKPGMYSPVNSGPLNSYLLPYQNPYVPPRSVWNPIPPYPTYTPIGGVKNSLINNMPLTTPQNSENNYIPLDEPYWRVPLDHSLWLPNFSPSQQQTKIPFFNSHVEQNPHPMMKYPQIYPISAMNYPEQYPRSLSNDIVPQEPSLMVTGPPPPGTVGKRLFKQKPSRLLNDTPYYQMGINSISPKVDLEQYPSSFMKYPSEYQNPIVNYPQWDDNYLQHILGSTANFPMQYPTMNYQQQYPSSLADYPQPLPYVSPYDYQGRMSLPISREKYPLPYLSPMANNVPWYMGAPLNNYYPQQYSSYFPQQYPSFPLFGSSPSDLSQSPFNSLPSGSFPYPYADSWAARNSLLNLISPDEGEADASSDARNEVYNQTNYQPDK